MMFNVSFSSCRAWQSSLFAGRSQPGRLRFRFKSSFLVLPASRFHDILLNRESHPTLNAYKGAPLSTLSPSMRGYVLGDLARVVDQDANPASSFEDPLPGECVNGDQRGMTRAEYDWSRDGLRIECKSGMLTWHASRNLWACHFSSVKLRPHQRFDELLLVLYTPRRIYICRHGGKLGLASAGRRTACRGHQIIICGPRHVKDWTSSLAAIISKLDGIKSDCSVLYELPLTDDRVRQMLGRRPSSAMCNVFQNVPLAEVSPSERGRRIEALVRCIDGVVNPKALIVDPTPGRSINGVSRGYGQAEFDWLRDGVRIECKSGQLSWDDYWCRWKVSFSNIKIYDSVTRQSHFDELFLALYTPSGIYIFKHDLKFALSSCGRRTDATGFQIQVYGPCKEFDWEAALEVILQKVDSSDCERVAHVQW